MNVRETMQVLPGWMQPMLTWVTGKPLAHQKPLWKSNPLSQLATALGSLFLGVFVGMVGYSLGGLFCLLMIPSSLFIIGAARKIQVMLIHQCSHFQFSGNRKVDRWVAEILSTIILTDHFDSYYREHIYVHHTKRLATDIDPDCKFLLELGFSPGMSVQDLKRKLVATVLSPTFHGLFMMGRLRANFILAPTYRKSMALCWITLVLSLVATTHLWSAFIAAVLIPLTFGYHVAAVLNFASLHLWLKNTVDEESTKERLTSLTIGRFCGDPVPQSGGLIGWVRWWARLLFYHAPTRIAVLAGDLPVHDYHHRYPRCVDWPEHLYTRQRDIDSGTPGWNLNYSEGWGLFQCIETVFETLSESDFKALETSLKSQSALAPRIQMIHM